MVLSQQLLNNMAKVLQTTRLCCADEKVH